MSDWYFNPVGGYALVGAAATALVLLLTFLGLPRHRLTPRRRAAYKARERDGLIEEFRANNHAVEAIDTMEAALGAHGSPHAQLVANGMIAAVEDPALGKTTQVGVSIHLQTTPGAITGPRPAPGQHNTEILGALGYADDEIALITGRQG